LDGWLIGNPALHAQRAPGRTCISALLEQPHFGAVATNRSKGGGGDMRVAPIGMFAAGGAQPGATADRAHNAFALAREAAALTHGHPTGQLPAGLFAAIIAQLLQGTALPDAIAHGMDLLRQYPDHEETGRIVRLACELATTSPAPSRPPAALGEGWTAEEALALSLYAALV